MTAPTGTSCGDSPAAAATSAGAPLRVVATERKRVRPPPVTPQPLIVRGSREVGERALRGLYHVPASSLLVIICFVKNDLPDREINLCSRTSTETFHTPYPSPAKPCQSPARRPTPRCWVCTPLFVFCTMNTTISIT